MGCSLPFTEEEQKHRKLFPRTHGNSAMSYEQNPLHALTITLLTSIIATLSIISNNYSKSGRKTEEKQTTKFISLLLYLFKSDCYYNVRTAQYIKCFNDKGRGLLAKEQLSDYLLNRLVHVHIWREIVL